jgi:GNAT superfamily N-acetyltransferase
VVSRDFALRDGSIDDLDAIMGLFDDSVVWLVANGRAAQWGSEPWSTDKSKVGFIRTMLGHGTTIIAELDGAVVGATIFGPERIAYAPQVEEPEIYIHLLITSPSTRGEGIGARLLDSVRTETVRRGISLLRVDCWSGGDRKLVSYYQRQGFSPSLEVEVREGTFVQVFEQRLQILNS